MARLRINPMCGLCNNALFNLTDDGHLDLVVGKKLVIDKVIESPDVIEARLVHEDCDNTGKKLVLPADMGAAVKARMVELKEKREE